MIKQLLVTALLGAVAPTLCQAETLQFYCHGNWDNGSENFASRYFVFILDTETKTYTIEGLSEGHFETSKDNYAAVEKDSNDKIIKSFRLDKQNLDYEFSYYATGLANTVGSKGQCQHNPS